MDAVRTLWKRHGRYNETRRKYISMYLRCRLRMGKFIELITPEDEISLRKHSFYVHKTFLIRAEYMYYNRSTVNIINLICKCFL